MHRLGETAQTPNLESASVVEHHRAVERPEDLMLVADDQLEIDGVGSVYFGQERQI